ncbi:MAG: DUF2520 domain-containing protein [Actinomycetota bacterium]|nr:DUF2520 domain-containing protein [Actinomycetota bacterium]
MATSPPSPFSYALVGAGRVGTAVAELLRRAGHKPIAVASRSRASATRAANLLSAPVVEVSDLADVDVVLLGISDAALESVVAELAGRVDPGTVVVHFAGSLGPDVLDPIGARPAALHPVQACPDVATAIARLPGSAWGVTTQPGLQEWATGVIERDLSGRAVTVITEDRALWHAAAVMTSNGAAAMLAIGESLLASIGIARPEQVLGPLARGTIQNAVEGGGGGPTLTGPLVRDEPATIERHLVALRERHPTLLPAFLAGLVTIVAAAREAGRISDGAADTWRSFLEEERWR